MTVKLRELDITGFIQLIVYSLLGENPKFVIKGFRRKFFYRMHSISVLL